METAAKTTKQRGTMLQLGLDGTQGYKISQPFLNQLKKGDYWWAEPPSDQSERSYGPDFDYNQYGYPMLPVKYGNEKVKISTPPIVLFRGPYADLQAAHMLGDWVLKWDGDGRVIVNGLKARDKVVGDHRVDFKLRKGDTNFWVEIREASETLRNIRVYQKKYEANIERGETFRPDFLESLTDYDVLRFMDWNLVNGSKVSSAKKIARRQDCFWSTHTKDYSLISQDNNPLPTATPYEVCLELGALTGKVPWICIPHMSDESVIEHVAEAIRKEMPTWLPVIFEYSNEVWNYAGIFKIQTQWCEERGKEMGYKGQYPRRYFYGWRSAECMMKLRALCPDHTIMGALGTFTNSVVKKENPKNPWKGRASQTACAIYGVEKYLESIGSALKPSHLFDVAITSYYQSNDNLSGIGRYTTDEFLSAIKDDPDAVNENLAEQFFSETRHPDYVLDFKDLEFRLKGQKETADLHGMDLICYEGGSHTTLPRKIRDNKAALEWYQDYMYSSSNIRQLEAVLNLYVAYGIKMISDFGFMGTASKDGAWGTLRHLNDSDNPQARVWQKIRRGN